MIKTLFPKIQDLNWDRATYSIASSEEKTWLWELVFTSIEADNASLQDFYLDKIAVYLIIRALEHRIDLVNELTFDQQLKVYNYFRKVMKEKESLIADRSLVGKYGVDITCDIKVNAIKQHDNISSLLKNIEANLAHSPKFKHKLMKVLK